MPTSHVNGQVATPDAVLPAQATTIFNARTIVQTLESLMNRVTEHEVTSETVLAACRCSAEISNLLRLHLEAERLQREDEKIRRAEERLRSAR